MAQGRFVQWGIMLGLIWMATAGFGQDAAPATPPAEQPEFPSFEQVLGKEYATVAGYYTLYRNDKKDTLYAELPTLGQEFLLATTFSTGYYNSVQWGDSLLRWDRLDDKLLLVEPEFRHFTSQEGPLTEAVKRTFTDRVVAIAPIACMGPNGNPCIDLKAFLTGAMAQVTGFGGGSLAKVVKTKAFPTNVEVAIQFESADGSMTLHYSISSIPETGYSPRAADPRVGYFITALKDFSRDERSADNFVRHINRWHLEKEDPNLKLSPAKNPIVFYIEKTVPYKYRRYVREGIEEWNKAFEKVGIENAIVVRQQTATNEFADLDPEDVRYNFIRWIATESAYAMGPSRVNPRTGQILDADIVFDQAMVEFYLKEYDFSIADKAYRRENPRDREFLKQCPEFDPWQRFERRLPDVMQRHFDEEMKTRDAARKMVDSRAFCSIAEGMVRQMSLAGLEFRLAGAPVAAEASPAEGGGEPTPEDGNDPYGGWPESFIGAMVKDVIMHEVGHTLGLRHNFKASAWRSIEQINTERPGDIGASVMDYNSINVLPGANGDAAKQGNYCMTTIGPYDYWAIEYGYVLDGAPENLARIASRCNEPGLAFATDEDAFMGSDPLCMRWDMGSDPLEFARQRFELCGKLWNELIERSVKPGESYSQARKAFNTVLGEYGYSCYVASRMVGGNYLNRNHRGDPNERDPVTPVEAEKQRSAVRLVTENMFSGKAFGFSPDLLNKLSASRWMHWDSWDWYQATEYPVHDMILSTQISSLYDLLNPFTVQNIYDAEMRTPAGQDAYTVPELFESLSGSICEEFLRGSPGGSFSNRAPMINSLRRNLQRNYIRWLTIIAMDSNSSWYPAAATTLAWDELGRLQDKLGGVLKAGGADKIDRYSRSHLEECSALIQKTLDAKFTLR